MGTVLASIAPAFYGVLPAAGGAPTSADWSLGFLFGAGGFAGVYIGARLQKYIPQKIIKFMTGCMIVSLALSYIIQYSAEQDSMPVPQSIEVPFSAVLSGGLSNHLSGM